MNDCDKIFRKVREYIALENMLSKDDRVIIGVSGGADSMCLLDMLCRVREEYLLEIFVVHINHGIRGQEADEDEQYVKNICDSYNVPFYGMHYDIPKLAKEMKMTEEEVGRKVRYESFRQVMSEVKGHKIAVAHNMNDNAETVLFNIIRGTGLEGMKGIPSKNGEIIRPIMCLSRQEIEQYILEREIQYRVDSTNLKEDYTRNRIRLNILPYIEENINAKVIDHINSTALIVSDTEEFMKEYINKIYSNVIQKNEYSNEYVIDCASFSIEKNIIKQRLLRKLIFDLVGVLKDISKIHIDEIIRLADKTVGKCINLPYGIICIKEYDKIRIYVGKDAHTISNSKPLLEKIVLNKEYYLEDIDKYIVCECIKWDKNGNIPKNNYTKWFDYDKINDVITLRNRQSGDVIQLSPNGNKKKLKDLMIDLKIDRDKRDAMPLLVEGSSVMWLIGYRGSEAYRVDDNTKRILQVRIYDK